MGLRRWGFYCVRAVGGFRRNPLPNMVSVLMVALCLFLTGACVLGFWSLRYVLSRWISRAEVVVYLSESVSDREGEALARRIAGWPMVRRCRFKSSRRVLQELKNRFPDLKDALEGLDDNPLPPALEIRLKSGGNRTKTFLAFQRRVKTLPQVREVVSGMFWARRTGGTLKPVLTGAAVFMGILLAGAALIVANTVRLSFYHRRDELEVLSVVGAPPAFIKVPFYMEGVLQGLFGALAASLPLGVLMRLASGVLPEVFPGSISSDVEMLGAMVAGLFVVGGTVSFLGAWIALRRDLPY